MIVTIDFRVDEEVTPRIFAEKVALACARNGAIREGESVSAGGVEYTYVCDQEVDLFGRGNFVTVPLITRVVRSSENCDVCSAHK